MTRTEAQRAARSAAQRRERGSAASTKNERESRSPPGDPPCVVSDCTVGQRRRPIQQMVRGVEVRAAAMALCRARWSSTPMGGDQRRVRVVPGARGSSPIHSCREFGCRPPRGRIASRSGQPVATRAADDGRLLNNRQPLSQGGEIGFLDYLGGFGTHVVRVPEDQTKAILYPTNPELFYHLKRVFDASNTHWAAERAVRRQMPVWPPRTQRTKPTSKARFMPAKSGKTRAREKRRLAGGRTAASRQKV